MNAPFKLPVVYVRTDTGSCLMDGDSTSLVTFDCYQDEHQAYIVEALNSYDKLKRENLELQRKYEERGRQIERLESRQYDVPGLGRCTDEDNGFVTLQFKDEDAAQAFMHNYHPTIEVDDMPDIEPACPCGEDGGTSCGIPQCRLVKPKEEEN